MGAKLPRLVVQTDERVLHTLVRGEPAGLPEVVKRRVRHECRSWEQVGARPLAAADTIKVSAHRIQENFSIRVLEKKASVETFGSVGSQKKVLEGISSLIT